jgi:quinol monooxygenase YgiN
MTKEPTNTTEEVINHLAEVCFGYGNARGTKLRALKLMDRLRELQQAEDNFGLPLPPFISDPTDPNAIQVIERWRNEERHARQRKDVPFFKDVARALEYLKKEEQAPKPDGAASEGDIKRLTAWVAFRMIRARQTLPFRDEVIDTVEYQLATNKFLVSPLTPIKPGSASPLEEVQNTLYHLRRARNNKERNWRRILKQLRLFDFLPTR